MQPLTAGITKANTGIDGIVWQILGQTYVPKQVSETSFAWHATFPPGTSVPPHIHPTQDEFIYMLEGELILRENEGETVLSPGDAAGFKAGSGIAHCLVNRSERDAVYLEVGTRARSERVHYPDVDFMMERDRTGRRYFRKSGEPIRD